MVTSFCDLSLVFDVQALNWDHRMWWPLLKSLFKKTCFLRIFHTSTGLALGPVLVNITRCWWWNLHQYTAVCMVVTAPVTSYSHSMHCRTVISKANSLGQLPSGYYDAITGNLILLCKFLVRCWRNRATN